MKAFLRFVLKPMSFLPALCMMYFIYSFSAQDGDTSARLSYEISYKIVETTSTLLGEELPPQQVDSIATRFHGVLRKLAHMTEYFVLAITVAFPLYVYGLRGIWLMLVAGFICVAFACSDEYHQSFVAGRGPSKRDVLIDSFGAFWGILLVRIVCWAGRKTIFRPLAKNHPHQKQYPEYPQYYDSEPPRRSAPPYAEPYNSSYYSEDYGSARRDKCTSDQLSEDMSLRKLVHDLKEQKHLIP